MIKPFRTEWVSQTDPTHIVVYGHSGYSSDAHWLPKYATGEMARELVEWLNDLWKRHVDEAALRGEEE